MKKNYVKTHLRLVSNNSSSNEKSASPVEFESSAPFCSFQQGENFWLIFISEPDVLRGQGFLDLLGSRQPQCLFDLRVAPRLDFFAPNRTLAFKKFETLGIDYVDVLGSLCSEEHVISAAMPDLWVNLVSDRIRDLDMKSGVFAFIFDDENALNRSRYILPMALGEICEPSTVRVDVFDGKKHNLIAM